MTSARDVTRKTSMRSKDNCGDEIYQSLEEPLVVEVVENKYLRTIKDIDGNSIEVDVYDVIEAFQASCPALQHLIKKALCAGLRGHKDVKQDLVDIRDSAERAIQLNNNRS